jgi:hypothetical protein
MRIEEFHAEEKERNEKIRKITFTKNAALQTALTAIVTEKNEAKLVGFIRATMKIVSKQQIIIKNK